MANHDDDEKRHEMAEQIARFYKQAEGPGARALRSIAEFQERMDKLLRPRGLAELMERQAKLHEKLTQPAERATNQLIAAAEAARARDEERKKELDKVGAAIRTAHEEREAKLYQHHAFVMLVQTRVLFHDCQELVKHPGKPYSAKAPTLVHAALEFPVDDVDEDVGKFAEMYVRAFLDDSSN